MTDLKWRGEGKVAGDDLEQESTYIRTRPYAIVKIFLFVPGPFSAIDLFSVARFTGRGGSFGRDARLYRHRLQLLGGLWV